MAHEVTRWACDICGKPLSSKSNAMRHEIHCNYDPNQLACVTCGLFIAWKEEEHDLRDGCDWVSTSTMFGCADEHDIYKIPGEKEERVLTKQCEYWQERTAKGTRKFGRTKVEEAS